MLNTLILGLGHTVTNFDDNDQTWTPTLYDVVAISESAGSSNNAWLKAEAVGIFFVEGSNWDELEFGTAGDAGGGGDTQIDITDNSHYITAVFPTGVRTVTTVATELGQISGWANGVTKLAHYNTSPTLAKLAYVDNGGVLNGGVNTAAERRAFFGAQYFANLTADGITLFNRAFNWAAYNTADHMVVTATDGAASTGGTEVLTFQLVDDLGNPVSKALAIAVTVTGSATFTANDVGGTNGSNSLTGTLSAGGLGSVTITNSVAETVTVTANATGDNQTAANVDDTVIFSAGGCGPATLPFTDDFNRANSATVGNCWVEELETGGADATIATNRLQLSSSDELNAPRISHTFTQVSTGSLSWSYVFNWDRTGAEGTYGLWMQLGNSATMVDPATSDNTGVAVNLKWAGTNRGMTNDEGFGYVQGAAVTEVLVVSGGPANDHTIEVIADLDLNTFELKIDDVTQASGVAFDNNVNIDAVRIYSDEIDDSNFANREFDDMTIALVSTDVTPPDAVADLATGTVTSSSIDLSWTAPGDDAATGTATTYDIRYSTSPITAGNWGSATQASGEPSPQVAGSGESFTVTGLSSATLYYFAIKTSDEVPNESTISNATNGTTSAGGGPPVERRVATGDDDAEEDAAGGTPDLTSSDLELVDDGGDQEIGIRFTGVLVPVGATITNAYVQFTNDGETSHTEATNLIFRADVQDNPGTFTATANNVTGRTGTTNSVPWNNIPQWTPSESVWNSPDLSIIIQEVIDGGLWDMGEAMVILITGTGHRNAHSYNGDDLLAPLLHIEYATDVTAPAAVANLATGAVTGSSIDLSWTAPGDDGATGTATTYDVRYSTSTITAGNWGSASQASGEPFPQVAGSSESFTVTGLSASTLYYFAIKTSDEIPNESTISNVPNGTTAASGGVTYQEGDGKGSVSEGHDAKIQEGSPTSNFGSTTDMVIDASAHEHSVIKFPNIFGGGASQIPLGSTITSATLTLEVFDEGDDVLVYQLIEAWDEGQVTWNERITGTSWAAAGADGTSHKATPVGTLLTATTGSKSVDVTASPKISVLSNECVG